MASFSLNFKYILTLFISGILILQAPTSVESEAIFDNGALSNIVVAISPNIEADDLLNLLSSLQVFFDYSSQLLFTATKNQTYFSSVNVLVFNQPYFNAQRSSLESARSSDSQPDKFQNADIHIDVPNAAYGDMPYVQQSRGCGVQGDFIHLTSDFVQGKANLDASQFGSREALFVQQWIKFRYGVFDEFGYSDDVLYPQQYYASTGNQQYNLCSDNNNINWDDGALCIHISYYDQTTRCSFKLNTTENSILSSMISMPVLPGATELCDAATHITEAPNKQNVFCNMQSVWEVVSNHSDFDQSSSLGPYFEVPKVTISTSNVNKGNSTLGIIVLWDHFVSDQKASTYPALAKFCSIDFPNGSYIGLMLSDRTSPYLSLTQLTEDPNARNQTCSKIDAMTGQAVRSINLPAAVQAAVTNFDSVPTLQHKSILLFTNSTSNTDWNTICSTAQSSGVSIHLFTYVDEAAQVFLNSDNGCTGQAFFIGSSENIETVEGNFGFPKIFPIDPRPFIDSCLVTLRDRAQVEYHLLSIPAYMDPGNYLMPIVYLQESLNDTTLSSFYVDDISEGTTNYFFMYSCEHLVILPDLFFLAWVGDSKNKLKFDESIVAFSTSEKGLLNSVNIWNYKVFDMLDLLPLPTPHPTLPIPISDLISPIVPMPYSVTAYGRKTPGAVTSSSISVSTWMTTDDTEAYTKMTLFASVKFGTTPVVGAVVTATVFGALNKTAYNIVLLDDGSGNPDISASDGIYTSYFTQFHSTAQTYTAIIKIAADQNGHAQYATDPAFWISGQAPTEMADAGILMRTTIIRSGVIIGDENDVIPPGNIYDLHLISYNHDGVTLGWTAPGNDLDCGQAAHYYLMCDENRDTVVTQMNGSTPPSSTLLTGITPAKAKTQEKYSIPDSEAFVKWCAIRADDDAGNYNAMSNVMFYNNDFTRVEPTTTKTATKTTTTTTTITDIPADGNSGAQLKWSSTLVISLASVYCLLIHMWQK